MGLHSNTNVNTHETQKNKQLTSVETTLTPEQTQTIQFTPNISTPVDVEIDLSGVKSVLQQQGKENKFIILIFILLIIFISMKK